MSSRGRHSCILLRLLGLCAASVAVLAFQNCAPALVVGLNEGEETLSSQHIELPADLQKTTFEPVLMDRYTLRSFLSEVFGTGITQMPSYANITNAVEYGSPCSLYENYLYQASASSFPNANTDEICTLAGASFTGANVNPKASVTRQAELPRLCSDLVHTDATYNTAIKRLMPDGRLNPAIDDTTLTRAFHLFYREKPAPQESLLDALKLLATPGQAAAKADWQNVLYTICASGHWQVL